MLRARAPVRGGSAQLLSRASTTPNDGNRAAHKIKSVKILLVADPSVGDGRLPGETAMLTEHDSLSHETVRRRPCREQEAAATRYVVRPENECPPPSGADKF